MLSRVFGSALALALFILASPRVHSDERARPRGVPGPLFQTSDRCLACHNGLSTPSGEDVSLGFGWRSSMMAHSARDPYWQASVRRETIDHPTAVAAIEDECSICHMPASRFESKRAGQNGAIFSHLAIDGRTGGNPLAIDGVTCSVCHQIASGNLGKPESFVGGFAVDVTRPAGERQAYGRFAVDPDHAEIMRSASGFRPTQATHLAESAMCATCHTLYTKALGPQGQVIGELPEQVPYQEWLHSRYRDVQSCQSCHMPRVADPVPITSVLGEPRPGLSRHTFVGGNFFVLRMLNLFRGDLSVTAPPQELDAAATRTIAHLQSASARIAIENVELRGGRLDAEVTVENLTGHKLPTAYPSRRAWLHVVVRDRYGQPVFESGALGATGAIQGNDADLDSTRFEPHYTRITAADQVQIYESMMVDPAGRVTTGLLAAVRYIKDNRLLPHGFDKTTADRDVAVHGEAAADADFAGGQDTVRYSVQVFEALAPFQIEAELWYQPIAFRWAANLKGYDASEPRRFTRYYDAMSAGSGVRLVRATAATR